MNAPEPPPATFASLEPGDRFPSVSARTVGRGVFACDTLAGRYQVFAFILTAGDAAGQAAIEAIKRNLHRFDDASASLLAVTVDPPDEARLAPLQPPAGARFLWDFEEKVSRTCGAVPQEARTTDVRRVRRFWLVVDPCQHVLAKFPFRADDPEHRAVFDFLDTLPPVEAYAPPVMPAPVLMLPNVFERAFCDRLIGLYEQHGGEESGVIRHDKAVVDDSFKRRKDYTITDDAMIQSALIRIRRRIIPELERLFFYKATRIERHIVACYAAEDGGHFKPHRDNNPGFTAHRRFALSINLNDDFEGGGVYFPEYSMKEHRPPAGWALIFPCAALHAVAKVTRGRRYAYLPFLYDEAAAAERQAFLQQMGRNADGTPLQPRAEVSG